MQGSRYAWRHFSSSGRFMNLRKINDLRLDCGSAYVGNSCSLFSRQGLNCLSSLARSPGCCQVNSYFRSAPMSSATSDSQHCRVQGNVNTHRGYSFVLQPASLHFPLILSMFSILYNTPGGLWTLSAE